MGILLKGLSKVPLLETLLGMLSEMLLIVGILFVLFSEVQYLIRLPEVCSKSLQIGTLLEVHSKVLHLRTLLEMYSEELHLGTLLELPFKMLCLNKLLEVLSNLLHMNTLMCLLKHCKSLSMFFSVASSGSEIPRPQIVDSIAI